MTPGSQSPAGPRAALLVTVATYVALTFLVWGLTAADRGLWQDDAAFLAVSFDRNLTSPRELFTPIVVPTRRLVALPFVAAAHTPRPLLSLQLLYGAIWLATGLAARDLAKRLIPGDPPVAYVAGALTLCATSDFLTNSPVELGYDVSALYLVLAACGALRWLDGRSWGWLAASCLLAQASLWTVDGGLPSLLLMPVLVHLAAGLRADRLRRALAVSAAWGVSTIPYALVLWRSLSDPTGYGASAVHRLPLPAHVAKALELLVADFAPWDWVFRRPVWQQAPPTGFPPGLVVGLAAVGTALFLWGLRYTRRTSEPESAPPILRSTAIAASLVAMAAASHAVYALVQFSEVHYRTQIYSRIWCSISIAILFSLLARSVARLSSIEDRQLGTAAALAIPALFVGFGIAGGLERQQFFLSGWQVQKTELTSLVEQAPELVPDSIMVLRMTETPGVLRLQATEAWYLAASWVALLYPPASRPAVYVWQPGREALCTPEQDGLRCFGSGNRPCVDPGTCPGSLIPYDHMVLFDFGPETGRYRLVETLDGAAAYAPHGRIRLSPPNDRQRRLLDLE